MIFGFFADWAYPAVQKRLNKTVKIREIGFCIEQDNDMLSMSCFY
jgi:hypothetical protein